ncbi:MAG: M24 family metallopeptidase [Elusimicrobiaceae bacterium]|nr:M24 family metallopeptidase [Elusimicrobiaceae bacterium]
MNQPVLQRVKEFQQLLKNANLSGYICLGELELRYFTGLMDLSDEEAVLLITPRKVYAITKPMMLPKLAAAEFLVLKVAAGDMLAGALDLAVQKKLFHLAFNPAAADFIRGEKLARAGLHRLDGGALELRKVKYTDEINSISKACQIAAEAFKEIKPQIKTGMTEEEVRILIALAMIKRGADSIPFNIVCFGENCADCHHTPSAKRKLKKNEAILMDFGCFYKGYCSDMTRSWWHGEKEPAEYTKIWHIVHMAKEAAVSLLRAGLPVAEVDKAARSVIEDAGYGKYFIHTTGHGIGLEVHEAPIERANAIGELEENFVVTVEPGIYLPGKYGVRLEDSYLVTRQGAKNLTQK